MGRTSNARDRLVAAAADLVHRRGYSAVSVADICTDAGLQKGSFYHFFKSKQALVLATLEAYASHVAETFERHIPRDGDARGQLQSWLEGMYQAAVDRKESGGCLRGCPVGNLSQEMAQHDPLLREQLSSIFGSWRRRLAATIRRGVEQGSLHVSDPDGAAEFLVALVQGACVVAKADDDPEVIRRITNRALASIEDPA
jgi:TetR/AcrR family transcriptional repressor of nem operon